MIGEVEDESRQDRDEKARNDQVACEEQGFPSQDKVISDVHILLWPTTA